LCSHNIPPFWLLTLIGKEEHFLSLKIVLKRLHRDLKPMEPIILASS
jgi:hypothetical protein